MILRTFAIATVATLLWASAGRCDESSQTVTLFDGRSLDGWEGNTKWFRARKGAIVAGSLTEDIPRNEFLCTKGRYGDFELHVKAKLIGRGTNAGVQFRSSRIPNHHEVIGYQADIGTAGGSPIWGCLYDESRRRKMLAVGPVEDVKKILRPGQFHQYVIRCQGDSVRIWLEGKLMVDYREPDAKISREGVIGLQIHGGPPAEAWYKDITIRELK